MSDFVIENGILVKYNGNDGDVAIPDGVIGIGNDVFNQCKTLETIYIPDTVVSIGDKAFCDCENLESITIPDTVKHIGIGAFCGCSVLGKY